MKILDQLYKELKSSGKVVHWNSAKTELMCRCPYCGDSQKDLSHTHFYIKHDIPYSFFCQRCEAKGVLSPETLHDFEVEDSELGLQLKTETREFFKNTNKNLSNIDFIDRKRILKYPKYQFGSALFQKKIGYLQDRFGKPLEKQDLFNFKIVNSLEETLILNNMNKILEDDKFYSMMKNADKEAVCFISTDNNYALFRYCHNNFKRRYFTLSLNYPYDIGHKVYSIHNQVSMFQPKIKLVLTEGIFDIISVYMNFYKGQDNSSTIFYSLNGKSFKLVPLLMNRLGFLNIDLEIYSDGDVTKYQYKDFLDFYRFDSILVHYNEMSGEKDFGVPINQIRKKTLRLK